MNNNKVSEAGNLKEVTATDVIIFGRKRKVSLIFVGTHQCEHTTWKSKH